MKGDLFDNRARFNVGEATARYLVLPLVRSSRLALLLPSVDERNNARDDQRREEDETQGVASSERSAGQESEDEGDPQDAQ